MKTISYFFMAAAIIFAVQSTAIASSDVTCKILEVGEFPSFADPSIFRSSTRIQLDDLTDTLWTGGRNFYISTEMGDKGTATALTAFASGKQVWVRLASSGQGSLVNIMLVLVADAP